VCENPDLVRQKINTEVNLGRIAGPFNRVELIISTKKVTLREIQSVIGLLNFACQVIAPGRAFCSRH